MRQILLPTKAVRSQTPNAKCENATLGPIKYVVVRERVNVVVLCVRKQNRPEMRWFCIQFKLETTFALIAGAFTYKD